MRLNDVNGDNIPAFEDNWATAELVAARARRERARTLAILVGRFGNWIQDALTVAGKWLAHEYRVRRERNRALAELEHLDAHSLNDMGLSATNLKKDIETRIRTNLASANDNTAGSHQQASDRGGSDQLAA